MLITFIILLVSLASTIPAIIQRKVFAKLTNPSLWVRERDKMSRRAPAHILECRLESRIKIYYNLTDVIISTH